MPTSIEGRDLLLLAQLDASFSASAEKAGSHLACQPGCAQCCHGPFAINALDAHRLRLGMARLKLSDPATHAAIVDRSTAWWQRHSASFPGDTATGILGTSEADEERFEEFANDAPCPLLNPGTQLCDLYSARPMTCRLFGPPLPVEGGFACCELCFTTAQPEDLERCAIDPPHEAEELLVEELADDSSSIIAHVLAHLDR